MRPNIPRSQALSASAPVTWFPASWAEQKLRRSRQKGLRTGDARLHVGKAKGKGNRPRRGPSKPTSGSTRCSAAQTSNGAKTPTEELTERLCGARAAVRFADFSCPLLCRNFGDGLAMAMLLVQRIP
eukprot:Skav210352  [mRNA]  locus=scaffold1491:17141:17521:+ [translate_table: standard]